MHRADIIAEIGLNANGNIHTATEMIKVAAKIGCDHVKFQKRDVDTLYTKERLGFLFDSPFGSTYGDAKRALEFNEAQYIALLAQAEKQKIGMFASAWDVPSVEFLTKFRERMPFLKIPSAKARDKQLLTAAMDSGYELIISTGMCSLADMHRIVKFVGTQRIACLMYCKSGYPTPPDELNLYVIRILQSEFPMLTIGYSGHEVGVPTSIAAFTLGAEMVERHFTLDRSAWGSDQAASLEPEGMRKLVNGIRVCERAIGTGYIGLSASEKEAMKRLPITATL